MKEVLNFTDATPSGGLVDLQGERYYRVTDFDAMPPFFMSLASDSDHWCFISSNGGLTIGRKNPDHALFPYYPDDRIHDGADQTGSKTILRVMRKGVTSLWEPFSQRYEGVHRVRRNLYKSVYGNKLLFEEINEDLGLRFRYEWMSSERFGFVRRCTLSNEGEGPVTAELLDGLQNILPCGLGRRFQLELSTLGDGYKRTELLEDCGLALFRLSSIPVDRPEPSEALRVNVAWSVGLPSPQFLLSTDQFPAFRRGRPLQTETDIRGRRGAYLVNATLTLEPDSRKEWLIVAELDQDAAGVRRLQGFLEDPEALRHQVLEDVEQGTRNLVRIVAGADGLQITNDELSTWRHFSNALFNVMRGGVPDEGYRIPRADFQVFLKQSNTEIARRHATAVEAWPERMLHEDLIQLAAQSGDVDLERIAREYLPLTFSRRHGDPSRPWNMFSIQVKDDHGKKLLGYQGNWRDVFQNWEALAHSYPGFLESMITKFANSSTADGYNPYRLLRDGYEWEVIDPHDPWSFIGYFGDHQVIYLLKLLETAQRYQPGNLSSFLERRLFTYADVPYRIASYDAMLADPHHTIRFDEEAHRRSMELAARLGSDGKALRGPGGLCRANLTEKLLVVALSKLSNYIPEAGIWMNTQRPEWNDANNALVGYGVSMVTLYYLRRYLAFCQELFAGLQDSVEISHEIAELFDRIAELFQNTAPLLGQPISDRDRKAMLDALGRAGEAYRERIYAGGYSGEAVRISAKQLQTFCDHALEHLDHTIARNRRSDGLYHSYNLMKVTGDGIEIRHLYEMLEGQVAVLSAGALPLDEALAVLDALRVSQLYRADQASYILYPDRELPRFLELNNLPEEAVKASKLLSTMLEAEDPRIVIRDPRGQVHFHADFRNADQLKLALDALAQSEYKAVVEQERSALLALYERVFDHQSFTGRSGTFYKYEGLGCIYWHMVSKLLLAVDELQRQASGDPVRLARLKAHYHAIREGIGVHKSPALYGAIPTDPYSHTPGFAGAQQPGMTGQVKEDVITRFSELGLWVLEGRLTFQPCLVAPEEFLQQAGTFRYLDLEDRPQSLELEPGTLAFTTCQIPVVIHKDEPPHIQITKQDGSVQRIEGLDLDIATSRAVFERSGTIRRLDVHFVAQGIEK